MGLARDYAPLPAWLLDADYGLDFAFYGASEDDPAEWPEGSTFSLHLAPAGRAKPAAGDVHELTTADGALVVAGHVVGIVSLADAHSAWSPGLYEVQLRRTGPEAVTEALYFGQVWLARGLSQLAELGGGDSAGIAGGQGVKVFRETGSVRILRGESAASVALASSSAADAAADRALVAEDRALTVSAAGAAAASAQGAGEARAAAVSAQGAAEAARSGSEAARDGADAAASLAGAAALTAQRAGGESAFLPAAPDRMVHAIVDALTGASLLQVTDSADLVVGSRNLSAQVRSTDSRLGRLFPLETYERPALAPAIIGPVVDAATGALYSYVAADGSFWVGRTNLSAAVERAAQGKGGLQIEDVAIPFDPNPIIAATVDPVTGATLHQVRRDGTSVPGDINRVRLIEDRERLVEIAPLDNGPIPIFVSKQETYYAGRDDTNVGRIPVVDADGDGGRLWFFWESRSSMSDFGGQYIGAKTSDDGGLTWTPHQVLVKDVSGSNLHPLNGANTCANALTVWDPIDRRRWLIWTWTRGDIPDNESLTSLTADPALAEYIYAMYLEDGEVSWRGAGGAPITLPAQAADCIDLTGLLDPSWGRNRSGPGRGFCMSDGTLVAACWGIAAYPVNNNARCAFVLRYNRETEAWERGAATPNGAGFSALMFNEPSIAEGPGGVLILNCRSGAGSYRVVARSMDRGATWYEAYPDTELVDSGCFGSLLNLSGVGAGDGRRDRLLLSNNDDAAQRQNLTLSLSYDGHRGWAARTLVFPNLTETVSVDWLGDTLAGGPVEVTWRTAYSCLTPIAGDVFGVAVEETAVRPDGTLTGWQQDHPCRHIMFHRFHLKDLIR